MADDSKSSAPWWVGLAVAIIGVIGTLIGIYNSNRQHATDLNAQKQELAEKHRNDYIARVREHDKNDKNMSDSHPGSYFSVSLENKCSREIYAAVWYQSLDGLRIVKGWFGVQPNQSSLIFFTQTRVFGFTAHTEDGKINLEGQNKETVTHVPFEYIDDEDFRDGWYQLPQKYEAGFIEQTITLNDFGQWIAPVTCSNS